jgi:NAD-dependent deacetylase
MDREKLEILKNWVINSNNIVFFGGAGVSTESGIPDFRSVDGIYHMKYEYPPETILSHSFFINNPKDFYDFYKEKMIYTEAEPNITHRKLADLERKRKLKGIITQNIDGLHQKAGSKNVLELHGSVHRNYCMKCGRFYDSSYIISQSQIPECNCGGIIKPDVVLYEETLDQQVLAKSVQLLTDAEVLIIGGTSLSVYPAAGLIRYYKGNKMVLINKSFTSYHNKANLLLNAKLGDIFTLI